MAWTNISDSALDADSPLDQATAVALRDNAIAIAKAETGAPGVISRVPPWMNYLGNGSLGAVTISANANIAAGEYHYTDLTINSGVTWTVSTLGLLLIRATGTVTIAGTINANYMGAPVPAAVGPGFSGLTKVDLGGYNDPVDTGYRHLCAGGAGGNAGGNGGYPLMAAATGGNGSNAPTSLAMLSVIPRVGGASGARGTGTAAPGRGGGVIIIVADVINFPASGTLTANGEVSSVGTNVAGAGGGGIIALCAGSYTSQAGTISVAKGVAALSFAGVYDGGNGASFVLTR